MLLAVVSGESRQDALGNLLAMVDVQTWLKGIWEQDEVSISLDVPREVNKESGR